jgi:hypothetical protein
MQSNEPTLNNLDDYDGNESPRKRKTINRVIIFCLFMGAILVAAKLLTEDNSEYIGTPEKPGIHLIKNF